uniref:Nuclear pore membrane glycoprotein 210-like n=1 Tax=Hirondellea gigas TaxID=1518452 RepID=A0A6A7FVY3_9CRUS
MKGYHRFPYADYGLLLSGSHEGELSVTVSLKSSSITATLKLRLVEHASIVPQQLVLYNHPSSTGYFTISGGSGYFTLLTQSKASDDQVATVSHVTANNSILVMAVDDGSRNIGISDLCLANSTARASVRVASVDTLTVLAAQLIEQGSTVQALLQLRDAEGLLIPIQPSVMRFTLAASQDEGILATEFVMINAAGEAVYEVTGRRLGDTTLIGSVAVTTEPRLTSQPCPVQVFAPLKLLPRHLTLVVGTVYQVTATGGPYPDARLEFYTSNKTVCDVSSVSGVVTAAVIGTTTVRARAYVKTTLQTTPAASTDESLHRAILECQDVVIIDVVAMASIELEAPTIHLESGTSMPLHVIGRSIIAATGDDEDDDDSEEHHQLNNSVKFSASKLTPVSYATADPPLLFEWSSSDKRVAALTNVFHENGILVGSNNNGVVRLLAHEPGHSTITVTVSPSRPTEADSTQQLLHNKIYTAKLRVKVFESLSLLAPNTAVATVLLAPGALYQLSTNRDGRSKMSYNIGSWCASNSSTNSSSGGGVVAVSKSGVLTATAHTGDATVLVTATDAAGVTQRVAILVQVRDVRYMQASVTRVLSVTGDSNLDSVPVGATLPLIITYHDNTGRTFDAVNNTSSTPLSVNANRRDHVRCESVSSSGGASVVIANVRAPGQTVLELQHAVSSTVTLKHYLRIPSRSAVLPVQACISVGQTLCYSTAIRGAKSEDGYWFSDGPQLAVDKNSGVATALSTGRTTVTYVIEADAAGAAVLAPYVDVTVQPIEQVLLMGPNAALSDGEVGDVIHVPIALIAACDDAGQDSAVATCYPPALPSRVWLSSVKCDISLDDATKYNINEVFVAEPVYTRNLGYSCAVRVLAQQVAWLGRLYQQQPSLSLTLRVTVANTGIPSLSKWSEVRLPFVASVHVNNTAEVVVSNIDPVEERLAVFGPVTALQQLLISSNSSSVEASLGSISATDGGMAERGVQVLGVRDAWGGEGGTNTPALITITSQLTRQTIPVVVSLQQIGDGSCASPKRPAETLGLVQLGLALLYHYHTHIFTVLCVVLTAASLAVGYQALFGPGYRQSQQAGVFAASPAAATPTSSPAAATPASPLSPNTGAGVLGGGNLNNISLWSIDSVYGAPHSPTTQGGRPSPRRL